MRLRDLEPEWVTTAGAQAKGNFRRVDSLAEAQGVMFSCPACYAAKGGTVIGVHSMICWSAERGADPEQSPLPGRWRLEGTSFDDLTLNSEPGPHNPENRRSVLLTGPGCGAHFHITNGEVTFC